MLTPGVYTCDCFEIDTDCNSSTSNCVKSGLNCHCEPGLTGENCETDINECSSNPCTNGICENLANFYLCTDCGDFSGRNCHCANGNTGENCDVVIDECASSPCSNGICTDKIMGYTCEECGVIELKNKPSLDVNSEFQSYSAFKNLGLIM